MVLSPLQWKIDAISNVFEIVVCKMAAILSPPQYFMDGLDLLPTLENFIAVGYIVIIRRKT